MELQTAIEILEYQQDWRLGKREDIIHEPKKLTEALDIVLSEVKKNRIGAVRCSVCTCLNAQTEKHSQVPVYCHNCKGYVQTDR